MAVFVTAIVVAVEAVGTAAFISTALVAISETGLALTVVGAATGNKDLMKVGGIMGMVGGIGALAEGAFGAAAGSAAEGAADAAASDAAGASFSDAAFDATGAAGTAAGGVSGADAAAATNALNDAGGATTNLGADAGSATTAPVGVDAVAPPATPAPVDVSAATPAASSSPIDPNAGATDPLTSGAQAPSGPTGPTGPADVNSPAGNGNTFNDRTFDASNPALNEAANGSQGWAKTIGDSLGDAWTKLPPQAKSELLKSVMAIPGGIQAQKNAAAQLALQQQKVNQTSYGSSVPAFGIINSAQKAG